MAWRLARALTTLRGEIHSRYPRTTVWTIGDQSHASGWSDHNPNSDGVVCAIDVKPDGDLNLGAFANAVKASGHPQVKYVIWNRRIWSKARNAEGWRTYTGSNPHTEHVHVSVGTGPDGRSASGTYDSTTTWGVTASGIDTIGGIMIGLKKGAKGAEVLALQYVLADAGFDPGAKDGDYGAKVSASVLACRRSLGSNAADGDEITGTAFAQILRALIRKQTPPGVTAAQLASAVATYLKANPPAAPALPAVFTFAGGTLTGVKAK